MNSPTADELVAILDRTTSSESPHTRHVATSADIERMRQLVRDVPIASHVKAYIARLVLATHPNSDGAPEITRKYVRYGASTRGAQAIAMAGKVRALRLGRANVAFSDVEAVAAPAMRHRLILNFEGQAEGVEADGIVQELIARVDRPGGQQ